MKDSKLRIGITQGDVNGIGYEVIIKTLLDPHITESCTIIVYGSAKVAAYHRKALNIDNFSFNIIRNAEEANTKRANIINCIDENIRVELGKSTDMAGEASYLALHRAIQDLKDGKLDAIVTCPINKHNIQSEKFKFPGHTEYLQENFGGGALMFMVCDLLKVGVVTGHIPLSKVASEISTEKILKKLRIMNQSLLIDFGIRKPKIAVLGLNPHAGDEGLLGNEEKTIILPAIQKANDENILSFGPFPSDGYFGSGDFKKFDAVLAMYHDQGLVPFKTMAFENGVNYTAGLPIVRTSPDHGTAYDLAGKDLASPNSFRNALFMAIDISKNRANYKELTSNPMKNYDISNM